MPVNPKVRSFFSGLEESRRCSLELIGKREEIVSQFTELSQAVQPLLDAVVTEDAARLIEHQRSVNVVGLVPE